MLAAYRAKIDPLGKMHIPDGLINRAAIPEERLRAAVVRRLDDNTADVEVPNRLTYRMVLVDGVWRILTVPSIASIYPSDSQAALRALTAMFRDRAAAMDATTTEITDGTLSSAPDV